MGPTDLSVFEVSNRSYAHARSMSELLLRKATGQTETSQQPG
jgi:hypothetical protein